MTLSPARRALLGTALALTLTFAGAAQAQTAMKLASATINDVQHEWQKEFAAEMEARMPGALTVEIYPASQLGAIPRMIEGVQFGTIEAFTTPTSFVTTIDPRFQAFDVPGLFHSPEEVDAVIHDPDYRDHLETLFLDKGVRVIGAIYNSPTLLLSKEPVTDVADFEGMKIRTFASPLQMKPMEAVGALPTPIALSEVPVQLQSGGIDGMLAGMPILTAFQYWDSAKYVTTSTSPRSSQSRWSTRTGSSRSPRTCRRRSARPGARPRRRHSHGAYRTCRTPTRRGRSTAARSGRFPTMSSRR